MKLPHEKGQGLTEYALLLIFVAMVVLAILMLMGPTLGNIYSQVTNNLGGV